MSEEPKTPKDDDGEDRPFADNLDETIIAIPLVDAMKKTEKRIEETKARGEEILDAGIDVILDLNILYANAKTGRALDQARSEALDLVRTTLEECTAQFRSDAGLDEVKSQFAYQHVFARLEPEQIRYLAKLIDKRAKKDAQGKAAEEIRREADVRRHRPVYKLWLDSEIEGQLYKSIRTVKADAAKISFGADGENICWAVLDSGVQGDHVHFKEHKNLKVAEPMRHMDFSSSPVKEFDPGEDPIDENGHGTHVAGIIAGGFRTQGEDQDAVAVFRRRGAEGEQEFVAGKIWDIQGVAPKCKILSLRVLDENGKGRESNIIAALGYISYLNASSRWPLIHGVNLSVGYEFKAEWFACGQSPLCAEVDRIVRSGLPVVTAAGNTGYGKVRMIDGTVFRTGLPLSINDPGNAALAITVGATHREHPHTYGVSYFSSKGPTGDGRCKPDLVAPGERIVSCTAGKKAKEASKRANVKNCQYREESGTSMAAPHVSGALAAFLSIRREFIGQPERLKEIFLSTCTDLGRERYFQGHGLLDLMRAIQSV